MKTRTGLVSNSSSSSFIITNTTDKEMTLVDFVKENKHLLSDFLSQYSWHKEESRFNQRNMINGAKTLDINFNPKQQLRLTFGDEQGSVIGAVYDYMLRQGGKSKSFKWKLKSCRGEQY